MWLWSSKNGKSLYKPARIQWNYRGILNTARVETLQRIWWDKALTGAGFRNQPLYHPGWFHFWWSNCCVWWPKHEAINPYHHQLPMMFHMFAGQIPRSTDWITCNQYIQQVFWTAKNHYLPETYVTVRPCHFSGLEVQVPLKIDDRQSMSASASTISIPVNHQIFPCIFPNRSFLWQTNLTLENLHRYC